LKYKADEKLDRALQEIHILAEADKEKEVEHLQIAVEGNFLARTLINEPLSFLTAVQLSKEIQKAGAEAGFEVEVFDKAKIQSLKMGGLLAVNRGSFDPPTFSIASWTPDNAKNEKPIILVGKGVVYDTGGLSLKPTAGSMDFMKSDMGGSAVVIGAMYAIAKAKLPLKVIALIPSTDNRPGNNAYAPGDVITMYDGKTVEVLNTDAEGRMLLADALAFAKKYDPELVFDFATLTGSAARAVGPHGVVMMGTADEATKAKFKESGFNTYERLVEFPIWEEYGEMLKSDIADIKNIGGKYSGAITAGKFLQTFTDYPWIHVDIAGSAFLHIPDHYRGKNGTGVGVRALFDFLSNY
ncbi:MAG: M17 family metallopeptidase, partial [Bacteroidota bacterium]